MSIIKIVILAVVVGGVIVVALGAVTAFSIFNSLSGDPEPLSPEVIAQGQAVERKIEDAGVDSPRRASGSTFLY